MRPLSIAIVGAGVGGLTASLALARQGHAVTLIERRTRFDEIGAGLQLSPNASRVLIDLGLGAALRRMVTEPDRVAIRSIRSGRLIGEAVLGPAMRERFHAPYWLIRRGDLQTILLDAVRSRPAIRIIMGRSVEALEQDAVSATLTATTAGGAREAIRADVVVGADGVWSTLRGACGDGRHPAYQGTVAWRATLPRSEAPAELSGDETGLWLGPAGHVVHYPIGANGRDLNIVVVERRREPVEGWSTPGDPAELQRAFGDAAPALRALLSGPRSWLLWSLFDLPARRMAKGRLALIGDAAHPVLPFLAQGAALAIEDAALLALLLGQDVRDPARTLKAFETARLSRARRVQKQARSNARAYHARGPVALARNAIVRTLGPDRMTSRFAWLYGWAPDGAS